MQIFSLELEKHFLSGLINNPSVLFDLDGIISHYDFYNDTNSSIFSVVRSCILEGEKFDKVLLAQKIKNLGITSRDEIDIFSYIDSLAFLKISANSAKKSAKELVKLRIKRQLYQGALNVQSYLTKNQEENIEDVVSNAEKLFLKDISVFDFDDEIENIFEGMEALVEEIGNNPQEEVGMRTPYPEFNRMYGGLRTGNIYAFVSRAGVGKSTILNDLAFKTSQLTQFKVPSLVLDTEMFTNDMRFRRVSAMTGVPMYYLESGLWRKNPEMYKKVRSFWDTMGKYVMYHYEVGNKNIEQVSSLVRRWYFSKVGRGNKAIVVYDYIKLTGEKVGQNWAEHQAIGDKIDKLKKLVDPRKSVNAVLLAAMQMNRSGESFNKRSGEFSDDSSAIALSDRLQWFATYVGLWRQKVEDEIAEDGEQFGTHKLITLKSRFQGKDAPGHKLYIKRPMADGSEKYVTNYLNYNVENFNVEERGSLRDVIEANRDRIDLAGERPANDGELM